MKFIASFRVGVLSLRIQKPTQRTVGFGYDWRCILEMHEMHEQEQAAANSCFRYCLQLVRILHPYNLSQPPPIGSAIFRMQGAGGCGINHPQWYNVGVNAGYTFLNESVSSFNCSQRKCQVSVIANDNVFNIKYTQYIRYQPPWHYVRY